MIMFSVVEAEPRAYKTWLEVSKQDITSCESEDDIAIDKGYSLSIV